MDVNVNVTLNASPSLLEFAKIIAGANFIAPKPEAPVVLDASAVAAAVVATPAKRNRSAKPETKVEETPEAPEEAAESTEEDTAPLESITLEEVRKIVAEKAQVEKAQTGGCLRIKELITKFGSTSVSSLNPEKYSAFYKEISAL